MRTRSNSKIQNSFQASFRNYFLLIFFPLPLLFSSFFFLVPRAEAVDDAKLFPSDMNSERNRAMSSLSRIAPTTLSNFTPIWPAADTHFALICTLHRDVTPPFPFSFPPNRMPYTRLGKPRERASRNTRFSADFIRFSLVAS